MSSPNQNKPGGKPGQRNRKPVHELSLKPDQTSQKPVQLNQKPVQQPSPKPVQQPSPKPELLQSQKPVQQQQVGKQRVDPALASANTLAIDFQTIATAYGDYTRKSFEET